MHQVPKRFGSYAYYRNLGEFIDEDEEVKARPGFAI